MKISIKITVILILFISFAFYSCESGDNKDTKQEDIPVTEITLNKPATSMLVGGTEALGVTFTPANATNQNITWSSSDDSKATISSNGLITAKAVGKTIVTATSVDGGKTSTCEVIISALTVNITGISLNKTSTSISLSQTEQLAVTITPVDATNQNLMWSSSDDTIVIVSSTGLVKMIGVGAATITATSVDGNKTSTCYVTDTFTSAKIPGETVSAIAIDVPFNMIYANSVKGIVFPTGRSGYEVYDGYTATLTIKFFLGETSVTNALFATVLQWAFEKGYISTVSSTHNEVNSTTVKYGYSELIYLDGILSTSSYSAIFDHENAKCRITFADNKFSVESGYNNHPVVCVTWYGAIIFCNCLTEMIEGNTNNIVYTWVDNGNGGGKADNGIWEHGETEENVLKKGFRLPSSDEWEFAARYIGQTAPTDGTLATSYLARNFNGGSDSLSDGYYWTPGTYASGAIEDYNDTNECARVSWFNSNFRGNTTQVQPVANKSKNALGIYDMCGNVWQWCFTSQGTNDRIICGGSWLRNNSWLQVGREGTHNPDGPYAAPVNLGLRLARTQ